MPTQTPIKNRFAFSPYVWIWISLGISIALHAVGLIIDSVSHGHVWAHEPMHSFVETSGATIGLAVAGLLLLMHRMGRGTGFNVPLAFGLIGMSFLDGMHALVHVGQAFVWLHSTATFAGGVLFAMVLLPRRYGRDSVWLGGAICLLLLMGGMATFVVPDALPAMVHEGKFTVAAVFLNIGGGVMMIAAALRLAIAYKQDRNRDDLLFAVHCMLFGGAAIMFEQSQLWDFSWWWWHGLRLAAYAVAFAFAFASLIQIQREIRQHRDELKKASESAVIEAEKMNHELTALRLAMDKHTLFSITDRAGKIVDVNEGFCLISGYSREELIGQDHRMLNSGHHPKAFWKDMWRTLQSGKPWRAEVCNRAKDGSLYWVDSTNIPKMDEQGRVVGFVSLRFDVTQKKQIENELVDLQREMQEQQERLSLAIDGTSDGLWDWPNVNADEEWWSPQFYQLLGYEPSQLPASLESFRSILHPEDMERCFMAVQAALSGKQDFDIEYRLKTFAHGYRWFRGRAKVYREAGKPDRMAGSICDIHSVSEARSELAALEQQMRLFVEHTPAAVAMFDQEMRYLLVSKGWVEQYELKEQEIIGRSHYEIFPTVPERWKTMHSRVLAGESLHSDRDRFELEDGTTIWVQWTLRPWHKSNGEIGGLMMFTQVINQQIEYEQQLETAVQQAEAASKSKSEFLANMSHEIRTPMTAILGYSDLLDETLCDDPAQAVGMVRTIQSNANHLLTIINDILDVSKIEAGQMAVEAIQTSPAQIISEVLSLVRPRAAGKGVQVGVKYETPLPQHIQSDPTRLRQILLNLMGNAIKFTEVGSVTIHASCDPASQQMKLSVIDTGIGMSPEQCEIISKFEAFSQADASTTRKFGGTGLGLRISNALTQMLGGGITVESVQGEGSTFTAKIATGDLQGVAFLQPEEAILSPQDKSATMQVTQAISNSDKSLDGVRILLAEDGPDNQRLISFHLKKAGAEVRICENGRIAVEALENMSDEELPSVILMDMQMPELDGYSATRRLREAGFTLPIIALTAHSMEGDRHKCLDAGCDDYLTKPIDKRLLVDTCSAWTIKPRLENNPLGNAI